MDAPTAADDTSQEPIMRTAIVTTYGNPDTIDLQDRPAPTAGPTELRVQVHASTVTQGDRRVRAGDFPGIMALVGRLMMGWSGPRAVVPGAMFAGVVESVGNKVTAFQPGDRVFGASMAGAHADMLVIDETKGVAHIPEGVSFADAAAAQFGTGTAVPFLRDLGEVQPGNRVLIIGAGGGVGRYAVQVARHMGAHVTAVCRADQAAWVQSLGAHDVIARDQVDWRQVDDTWHVVFDTSDLFTFADAQDRLTAKGRFLTLGVSSWSGVWDLLRTAMSSGKRARWTVVMDDQANVQSVGRLLASGAIRAVTGPRFPLERLADAHRALEERTAQGDVIIDVIPPTPALAQQRAC